MAYFQNLNHSHKWYKKYSYGYVIICLTDASAWVGSDGEEKGQIDLVINRRDSTINLCEMKYSMGPYEITKVYHEKLRSRMSLFKRVTGTTKSLVYTMVTTYGIKRTKYCDVVNRIVTMDDLFL